MGWKFLISKFFSGLQFSYEKFKIASASEDGNSFLNFFIISFFRNDAVLNSYILEKSVSYELFNLETYLENKSFNCSSSNDDARNFAKDLRKNKILVKTKKRKRNA